MIRASGRTVSAAEETKGILAAFAEMRSAFEKNAFAREGIEGALANIAVNAGIPDVNGFVSSWLPQFAQVRDSKEYRALMTTVTTAAKMASVANQAEIGREWRDANREDVQAEARERDTNKMTFDRGQQEAGAADRVALEKLRAENQAKLEQMRQEHDRSMQERAASNRKDLDATKRAAQQTEWMKADAKRFVNTLEILRASVADNEQLFTRAMGEMGDFINTLSPAQFRSLFEGFLANEGR